MKKLELNRIELVNGGTACAAVSVSDAVVGGAAAAAEFGWLALNPIGGTILAVAAIGLAGASLYCAFS